MSASSARLTIASVDYWPILIPDSPILNKSGLHAPQTPRIIMRIRLSDGSCGWSEVPCNRGMLLVLREVVPRLSNTPADIPGIQVTLEQVVQTSKQITAGAGINDARGTATFDKGVTNHVRAAIQMAAYDALAVHQHVPLADLLAGGKRRRDAVEFNLYLFWVAHVGSSGLFYPPTTFQQWNNPFGKLRDQPATDIPSALKLARVAYDCVMPGARLIKWKCGVFPPDVEAQLIIELDLLFERTVKFVPDPNGAWDVDTAVRIARMLKDALGDRLPYVEDLVMGREAMAQVYAQTGIPQATNMCAADFSEHRLAVDMKAIQITLGGDPHYMGGCDHAVELSRLCDQEYGIQFAQHSNSHTEISLMHTAHMGAAAYRHDFPFDTHYFPWQSGRGVLKSPIVPEHGGIVRIADRPGIGINVSEEKVLRLHEVFCAANSNHRSCTDRDDGPPADLVFGSWSRPGTGRKDQWFTAGLKQPI